MRKVWLLAIVGIFVVILAACGGGESKEVSNDTDNNTESGGVQMELKLGTIRTEDDPTTQAAMKFAEIVNEKTNGEIQIDVFPNSQIGDILDMFSGMQSGTVDMMYEGISSYSWLDGAEVFNIMSLPFYWEDYDQMTGVLNSEEFAKYFEEAAQNTGVRVINAEGDTEARQLTANKPVQTAEDFKGLKIRTAESEIVQKTMKELGASPVVIPFSDLYMSLQQGIVDAQENGFITVKNNSFYEVQDYLMKTDYIRDVKAWYISENVWNKLSDEQKEVMYEASVEAGQLQTKLTNEIIDETLDFLKEEMEYVEPDLDSIREALKDLITEFDGELWPEGLYEEVESIRANLDG